MGLIFFRGGPYDGKAFETETLMGKQQLMAGIDEYDWTPEKITSSQTGATAQVWVHRGGVNKAEDGAPVTSSTSSPENAETSNDTTSPSPAPVPSVDDSTSSERASTPSPARSSSNGTAVTVEYLQSLNLRERREALKPKASRKVVSDATGLPQSKVYGIETGEGKRIKSDEVDKYLAYIVDREGANASAHA